MPNPIYSFGDSDTGVYSSWNSQVSIVSVGVKLSDSDWAAVYIGILKHKQPADVMYDIYRAAVKYEQAKARKI